MSNGLTAKEEAALKARLKQLDAVNAKNFLMGWGEARRLEKIAADIRLRLDPPTAKELDELAETQIKLYSDIPWVVLALAAA